MAGTRSGRCARSRGPRPATLRAPPVSTLSSDAHLLPTQPPRPELPDLLARAVDRAPSGHLLERAAIEPAQAVDATNDRPTRRLEPASRGGARGRESAPARP